MFMMMAKHLWNSPYTNFIVDKVFYHNAEEQTMEQSYSVSTNFFL